MSIGREGQRLAMTAVRVTAEGRWSAESSAGAVRAAATRYIHKHPVAAVETAGAQLVLGFRAIQFLCRDVVARRFPWREFVHQGAFMAGTAVLPTLLVAIPVGVTLSIQFSLLASQVGASSMAGGASGLAVVRQGASLVAAIMMASAVGSAVCADLGSRTMREEIDALEVMGISTVRRLIAPRLAAAVVVAVGLTGTTCFAGFSAAYLFNVYVQHGSPGSFVSTFASFATVDDLVLALFKAVLFGVLVAVVACQKGLSVRGGPAGVADAVNATVVESILALAVMNVGITQAYVTFFPRHGL